MNQIVVTNRLGGHNFGGNWSVCGSFDFASA
jgi:hypothetical protein